MNKLLAMFKSPLVPAAILFFVFAQIPVKAQESAQTKLIDRPGEAIRQNIPIRSALPATISIDAMTSDEIQVVRRDLYAQSKKIGDNRCLAWVFKKQRHGENNYSPIGFIADGELGAIKVNGNLRPMSYFNAIEGVSRLYVLDFTPVHTYSDLLVQHQIRFERFEKPISNGAMMLKLYFKNEKVESKDMSCTLMQARCRRYTAELQSIEWEAVVRVPQIGGAKSSDRLGIRTEVALPLAIEDMCPFRNGGVIEGPWRSRIGGEGAGVRKYGLRGNSTLYQALEPYISNNLKSKK